MAAHHPGFEGGSRGSPIPITFLTVLSCTVLFLVGLGVWDAIDGIRGLRRSVDECRRATPWNWAISIGRSKRRAETSHRKSLGGQKSGVSALTWRALASLRRSWPASACRPWARELFYACNGARAGLPPPGHASPGALPGAQQLAAESLVSTGTTVLYRDTISGSFRVFLHHTDKAGVPLQIGIGFTNPGDRPCHVGLSAAPGGLPLVVQGDYVAGPHFFEAVAPIPPQRQLRFRPGPGQGLLLHPPLQQGHGDGYDRWGGEQRPVCHGQCRQRAHSPHRSLVVGSGSAGSLPLNGHIPHENE